MNPLLKMSAFTLKFEKNVKCILFLFNPVALRKAKIAYNFGLSECNRVKQMACLVTPGMSESLAHLLQLSKLGISSVL